MRRQARYNEALRTAVPPWAANSSAISCVAPRNAFGSGP